MCSVQLSFQVDNLFWGKIVLQSTRDIVLPQSPPPSPFTYLFVYGSADSKYRENGGKNFKKYYHFKKYIYHQKAAKSK